MDIQNILDRIISKRLIRKDTVCISHPASLAYARGYITHSEYVSVCTAIEDYIYELVGTSELFLSDALFHKGLRNDYKYILSILKSWNNRPYPNN
mgnify:FL=1